MYRFQARLAPTLLMLLPGAALAQTTFSDGNFLDSDWSHTVLIDTTPGAVVAANRVASGGNPDAYRETRHEYLGGSIIVAHLRSGAVYDPAVLGGISTIDVSYDLLHSGTDPFAVRYRLLLLQNGRYYVNVPGDLIFSGGWQAFAHTGLTEADFVENTEFDTSVEHPDFGPEGAPIQFGYRTSNRATALDPQVRISGIDNWTLRIHPGPVSVEDTSWGGVKALYR